MIAGRQYSNWKNFAGSNMLHLKRITHFNEFLKCQVSDEIMMYGDFYYEDDEDGLIVSAKYYHDLKKKKKEDEFDYTELNNAQSQKEYQDQLRQAERELFESTVLDRKVFGKDSQNYEREVNS